MSIVNPGITFVNNGPGAGVTIQANGPANISISVPGFNIGLGDITNPGIFYSLGTYLGSGSWQVQNPAPGGYPPNAGCAMYFYADTPTLNVISAVWARLGYDPNSAYAFNARWASGQNTTVRLAYGTGGTSSGNPTQVDIVPIDTGFIGWQSTDPFTVPSPVGTYTLPVTLTPFTEPTPYGGSNWC
jgi:hypothetical protein